MNPTHPAPHVSPALASLRFAVTFACVIVALSALVHLGVYMAAQFSEARWETPRVSAERQQSLAVIPAPPAASRSTAPTGLTPVESSFNEDPTMAGRAAVTASTRSNLRLRPLSELEAAQRLRTVSRTDRMMQGCWETAAAAGTLAAVVAFICVFTGLVIAGGASVPGVDSTVHAMLLSLAAVLCGLPLQSAFPSIPWPGVFGEYLAMTSAIDARAGAASAGLFAAYGLVPFVTAAAATAAAVYFRLGVAKGVIATSVNDLDAKLESEMEALRKRGITSHFGGRSVGALNQAIGTTTAVRPAGPDDLIDRLAAEASIPAAKPRQPAPDRRPV
jgi:hypothetical protein